MTPTPTPAAVSLPPTAGSLAERLAAITHDLLGAADGARHLVWANPAWHALLGWTADELASRSYLQLLLDAVRAHDGTRAPGGGTEFVSALPDAGRAT